MEDKTLSRHLVYLDLFERYGALLTEREADIFRKYYEYDLSLSEIAEELGITRSAVSNSLNGSQDKLRAYEEKLGLSAKRHKALQGLSEGRDPRSVLEELIDGI